MCKPITDEETEEIKEKLRLISLRSSIDQDVIDNIKKGLEIIIKLQVENSLTNKRESFYKRRYEKIKNKEDKK